MSDHSSDRLKWGSTALASHKQYQRITLKHPSYLVLCQPIHWTSESDSVWHSCSCYGQLTKTWNISKRKIMKNHPKVTRIDQWPTAKKLFLNIVTSCKNDALYTSNNMSKPVHVCTFVVVYLRSIDCEIATLLRHIIVKVLKAVGRHVRVHSCRVAARHIQKATRVSAATVQVHPPQMVFLPKWQKKVHYHYYYNELYRHWCCVY